jgi:hypothetical protein
MVAGKEQQGALPEKDECQAENISDKKETGDPNHSLHP